MAITLDSVAYFQIEISDCLPSVRPCYCSSSQAIRQASRAECKSKMAGLVPRPVRSMQVSGEGLEPNTMGESSNFPTFSPVFLLASLTGDVIGTRKGRLETRLWDGVLCLQSPCTSKVPPSWKLKPRDPRMSDKNVRDTYRLSFQHFYPKFSWPCYICKNCKILGGP